MDMMRLSRVLEVGIMRSNQTICKYFFVKSEKVRNVRPVPVTFASFDDEVLLLMKSHHAVINDRRPAAELHAALIMII